MELKSILARVDHTLLTQTATWADIRQVCDDGARYGCATVCIPACYVAQAADYLAGALPVCTVVGFPNGYSTTAAKCFEAEEAARQGAAELDMVLNAGWVKDGRYGDVLREIQSVRAACPGRVLKVIVETCLLTEEEKRKLCQVVGQSGADYVKTSTGFAGGGATREDVALLRAHAGPRLKIKAAGGIATLQDAEDFLRLGADRLGTSRVVRAVKELEAAGR